MSCDMRVFWFVLVSFEVVLFVCLVEGEGALVLFGGFFWGGGG